MELMELTALVDEYDTKREQRLAADKVAAQLKREEEALAATLIREMRHNDTVYCAGHHKRVRMTTISKPKVEDWVSYWSYMRENDAMDLVQKRVHESALADRVEAGEQVPGVTYVEFDKLSIGKI